jgi:hypothetical protein
MGKLPDEDYNSRRDPKFYLSTTRGFQQIWQEEERLV